MSIYLFGELMLDVVALTDQETVAFGSDTVSINSFHGGGSAANTASWLGTLGLDPIFIGVCGRDAEGDRLIKELAQNGVRTITVRSDIETGSVVSIVSRNGQRSMFPYQGANVDIRAELLPQLNKSDILYIVSYSLFSDGSRAETRKALALARAAGATTAIDAASYALIEKAGIENYLSWIAGCEILFLNGDEARTLGGSQDLQSCARHLSEYARYVVIKDGESGAFVLHDGVFTVANALPANVIDTTGAGDGFAAGFLSEWAGGQIHECLKAGLAVAAQVISRQGARPAQSSALS